MAAGKVSPVRERGLKRHILWPPFLMSCRSREGAWIEIVQSAELKRLLSVAPVRERGLKSASAAG